MGEKDKTEKYLEAYNDVFADIFNVLVFEEDIIIPDSLVNAGTETIYKSKDGKLKNQLRDIQKYYNESHIQIASLGIENQSEEDKDMVIRILGYDYASYREQIINKKDGRYPVITIVLNFSEEKWSAPKSLIEVLDIPKELEGYVEDYHIKVYDIAYLPKEIRDRFKSDFKVVADFFAEKRLGTYDASKHKERIIHVEAVLEMLRVFTKDERYKEIEEIINKNLEGDVSMCKVLDEYERRGIEKGIERGIERGIEQTILNLVKNNRLSVEVACEELNISKEEFEEKMSSFNSLVKI
ncbi:MAG: Rpn family recombination-promoting nuclease/putative transposase [Lachnospiraceae bacterium]|nr:Rpn family recombination-promoting nuclease/putative transposase [Lachnospiraceae bacterium]